ncbi:rhomboid family intramembrane serine protease [Verrucomicrobia bacterium LW23]|nr:rhomboid family intramembrane serine protease [Verrucomicrobia bacterium LW23]
MALFSERSGSAGNKNDFGLPRLDIEPSRRGPLGPEHAFETTGGFVALLYIIWAANWTLSWLHLDFRHYGIIPRTFWGLLGVLFAPLLHANLAHLMANTIPLFVLMSIVLARPVYKGYAAILGIWILGGLATWALARGGAVHIGASGLIYGMAAYLIAAGFTMMDVMSLVVGLAIAFLYSGLIFGLVPSIFGTTSWEGHLFGAIAGVLMAFVLHGKAVAGTGG